MVLKGLKVRDGTEGVKDWYEYEKKYKTTNMKQNCFDHFMPATSLKTSNLSWHITIIYTTKK